MATTSPQARNAAQQKFFDEAIAAARRGERVRARELFTRLLRYDQEDPQIWLWMSSVVDSDRERLFCLNKVRALDPENNAALRGLALLGQLNPEERAKLGIEAVGIGEGGEKLADGGTTTDGGRRGKRGGFRLRRNRTLEWLLIVLLSVVVLVGLPTLFFGGQAVLQVVNNFINPPPTAGPATLTPTPAPVVVLGTPPPPTLTPTPTQFSSIATPIDPERLPNLHIAVGLNAPLTATPLPETLGRRFTTSGYAEYNLGLDNFERGDFNAAREDFTTATNVNRSFVEAYYYLGLTNLALNNALRAAEAFNQAVEINPDYAPGYYGRALANSELGNSPEPHLLQAIEADPTWGTPYAALARHYLDTNRPDEALALTTTGLNAVGPHVELSALQAEAWLTLDDTTAALEVANAGIAYDPTHLPIYLVRAGAYLALERPQPAQRDLNLYTAYVPNDPAGWLLLGETWLALEEPEAAIGAFSAAIDLDRTNVAALFARADLYYELEELTLAEEDYARIVALNTDPQARFMLGQIAFDDERYSRAAQLLDQAAAGFLSRNLSPYQARLLQGRALLGVGTTADAIVAFTQAINAAEDDLQLATALLARAETYAQAEREEDAREDLDAFEAIELPPSDEAEALRRVAIALRNQVGR